MINYAEVRRFQETQFGQVRYLGTAEELPQGNAIIYYIDLEGFDPQPLEGWYFDDVAQLFTEALPAGAIEPKKKLAPTDFWFNRFTEDERAATWASLAGVDLAGVAWGQEKHRWRVKAWHDLTKGQLVDLADLETVWAVSALELAGVLAAGRAAVILA